jgi:cell division transport system permease protein
MAIKTALEQTGKVSKIDYISKDEAFNLYKQLNKDDPKMVELVTASILPASLEVSTTNPQDLSEVAKMLSQEPVIGPENVAFPTDVIEEVTKFSKAVRWTGGLVVGFLMIFSLLIILMIIGFKIRVKRNEIEIMKLLGASTWFIRAPFLLEGIFYSMLGAILAWIISLIIMWYATPFVQNTLLEIDLLPMSPLVMLGLLAVSLLVALCIGFVGSYGAIRRYLHL